MASTPDEYFHLLPFDATGLTTQELCNKLDHEILQLQERILTFQTIRNSLTPISKFPPEILSNIFVLLLDVDSEGGEYNPIPSVIISWVCRQWRHVALSTPQLWTRIADKDQDRRIRLDRVQAFQQRSGNFPISVKLSQPSAKILAACLSPLSRISKLTLADTSLDGIEVAAVLRQTAPILASLELKSITLPSLNLFSGHHPNLSLLRFYACFLPLNHVLAKSLLATTSITRLDFADHRPEMTGPSISEVLTSLPNLQELVLVRSLGNRHAPAAPIVRVPLPSLQILTIWDKSETAFTFLEWFDIPQTSIRFCSNDIDIFTWSIFWQNFGHYQERCPFEVRYVDIRPSPNNTILVSIAAEGWTHQHSFQLRYTPGTMDIWIMPQFFQVTTVLLSEVAFGPAAVMRHLDNLKVLTVMGSIEHLQNAVDLLSQNAATNDHDQTDADEHVWLFPALKELSLSQLDDELYERLIEILALRADSGLGRIKLKVIGRETRDENP